MIPCAGNPFDPEVAPLRGASDACPLPGLDGRIREQHAGFDRITGGIAIDHSLGPAPEPFDFSGRID
jgi:hypothetical protein